MSRTHLNDTVQGWYRTIIMPEEKRERNDDGKTKQSKRKEAKETLKITTGRYIASSKAASTMNERTYYFTGLAQPEPPFQPRGMESKITSSIPHEAGGMQVSFELERGTGRGMKEMLNKQGRERRVEANSNR